MFRNAGRKIKVLAKIFFWIGVVFDVLVGISIMFGSQLFLSFMKETQGFTQQVEMNSVGWIITGAIVLIVSLLSTWISSLLVYGFGELIDNTMRINRKLSGNRPKYVN